MADDPDDSEWEFETGTVTPDDAEDAPDQAASDEWRFSLSDLPDEAAEEDDQSATGGNVFGSLSSDSAVIESGSPDLENTLFVVVGAVLALLFFLQFYLLMG